MANFGSYIPERYSPKFIQQPEEELLFTKFLVERTKNAAFCLGADARFLYVNNATCSMMKYSREELLSMSMDAIDSDFSPTAWAEQWQVLRQQGSLTVTARLLTKLGRIVPAELNLIYIEDNGREFSCAFARRQSHESLKISLPRCEARITDSGTPLIQQITELETTKTELEKSLALLDSTLESTATGILSLSSEGNVLKFNQKFADMWQIPESVALSRDCSRARAFFENQVKNLEVFRNSVWEISSQSSAEGYHILELKNGRTFAQYSQPQYLGEKIIGRVWSLWDVTELKQTEEALQQKEAEVCRALEQAKQLGELKSFFISIVCHQFRSLLNIVSFSNGLLIRRIDQLPSEKKQHYLNHIEIAVKQLSQLLDEILFYEKSEVGKLNFEPAPLDLHAFCSDLLAQTYLLSNEEQVIDFVSKGSFTTACMDKKLLQHILINLLSNAIKYSPKGSKVKFELLCEGESAIFQIQDAGIGIPAAERQRLFEPFYRASNVGDTPGVGLGLAIVKNLVDLHQGQITVDGEVGVGTTFTVKLPLFSKNLAVAQENSSPSW